MQPTESMEKGLETQNDEQEHAPAQMNSHVDEEASKVLQGHGPEQPISRSEEAQLVRKIDWLMMPIMSVTFGMFIIDKGVIGIGTLFGLLTDLDLATVVTVHGKKVVSTGKYSNVSSIFYVGYVCGAYPLTQIAQRYPIARMASLYTLFWGITVICFPACTNYTGVMIQRFAQGFFEAGVLPTYGIIVGMWYTKSEQAFRNPLWFSGGFIFAGIGYVINYGLTHIDSTPLKKWQLLYIFWGGLTILWAVVALALLPNSQASAKGLTDRQKFIAVERLRSNQDTLKNSHFKTDQAIEALTDARIWVLGCFVFCVVCPTAMATTFAPVIFKSMGFSTYTTVLMSAPGALVGAAYGIGGGYYGMRVKNSRIYIAVLGMVFVLIALITVWKVPRTNHGPALFGVFFLYCYAGVTGQVLTFVPSNVGGSTKKSVASGIVYVFYCAGNIASPLFFKPKDAPNYNPGVLATLICSIFGVVSGLLYYLLLARENKRRDSMGAQATQDHAFSDLTDRQNLSFRYAL